MEGKGIVWLRVAARVRLGWSLYPIKYSLPVYAELVICAVCLLSLGRACLAMKLGNQPTN